MKFPEVLYVRRETDGSASYLLCDENLVDLIEPAENQRDEYAVYQLLSKGRGRVVKTFKEGA